MKYLLKSLSKFLILAALTLPYISFAQQSVSQAVSFDSSNNVIPACVKSGSDSDGDGWGWENNKTCHVGGDFKTNKHPICQDSNSDPDGDGWGWENAQSCQIIDKSKAEDSQVTSSTNQPNKNQDIHDDQSNDNEIILDLSQAKKNKGFAYTFSGEKLKSNPDSENMPSISKLRFFENGVELGPPHSGHNNIRDFGSGRFSDWQGSNGFRVLWFSTSDNSDPRTNGRTYTYSIEGGSLGNSNTSFVDSQTSPAINQAQTSTSSPTQVVNNIVYQTNNNFINPISENGKLLAFPGAKGYARFTKHARGCKVVLLNTLENDKTPNNGKVSFYEAMTMKGCRYIIPTVGGVVKLPDTEVKLFGDQAKNVYFAGQAAPAPGLVIETRLVNLGDYAKDFLMRHVTFRGAKMTSETRAGNSRALSVSGGHVENIFLDHISASWATDETTAIYLGINETGGIKKVSWTNSIMAEGDAASLHPESLSNSKDGLHATGAQCQNNNLNHDMEEVSFIGNLIVDQNQRLPVINGCHAEIFDNYMANWRWSAIKVRTQTREASVHIANNVFAPGDQSPVKAPYYQYYKGNSSKSPIGRMGCNEDCTIQLWFQKYVLAANIGDNYIWPRGKPWSNITLLDDHPHKEATSRTPRFKPTYSPGIKGTKLWSPNSDVWNTVGHTVPVRDEVDKRIIRETKSRTNILGIDDYNRMDGKSGLTPDSKRDFSSYKSTKWPSDYDSDKDGMSDVWEASVGLNPNDGSDHSKDRDGDGLTNIEEFLSKLAGD